MYVIGGVRPPLPPHTLYVCIHVCVCVFLLLYTWHTRCTVRQFFTFIATNSCVPINAAKNIDLHVANASLLQTQTIAEIQGVRCTYKCRGKCEQMSKLLAFSTQFSSFSFCFLFISNAKTSCEKCLNTYVYKSTLLSFPYFLSIISLIFFASTQVSLIICSDTM